MSNDAVRAWHQLVNDKNVAGLDDVLADDAVFHSPIVHTPQEGKQITKLYLAAAFGVLASGPFHYVREVVSGNDAVLEFETEVEGIFVNGVDMIHWNDEGKIVDFKVMIRPLKAVNLLHQMMAAMLKKMQAD
jgi:ketosteroid isomerase-like protein